MYKPIIILEITRGLVTVAAMSIDVTRSALIAVLFNGFFPAYSAGYYAQHNLQYLALLGVVLYYRHVVKRYIGTPTFSGWFLAIFPLFGFWAALTYLTDAAYPLRKEHGINIYGPVLCLGLFCIISNLIVFYIHTNLLRQARSLALTVELEGVRRCGRRRAAYRKASARNTR